MLLNQARYSDTFNDTLSHWGFRGDTVENCAGQMALGMAGLKGKGSHNLFHENVSRQNPSHQALPISS